MTVHLGAPAAERADRDSWWRHLSIRAKAAIVISLPLACALIVSGALVFGLAQQARSYTAIERSVAVLNTTNGLLVELLNAETGVRGFLTSGDVSFLAPYQEATAKLPQAIAELSGQLDGQEVDLLTTIDARADQEMALLDALATKPHGSSETAALLAEGKTTMDQLRGDIAAVSAAENAAAQEQRSMAESAQRLALMVGLSCLVIGIAGVLAALYLMDRTVIARIKVTQDAAERLGQGLTLPDADTSPDEIGRLDAALHRTADILATRSREINDATRKALEARSEAEAANSAKNEFMSRISHELRTPLNAVLGFGQLLQADTKSPADQESVNQILDGGRHLLQLVNEVLDITQAESGNLLLARQPTDIAEALSAAIDLAFPIAQKHRVTIRNSQELPIDHFVLADPQRLHQVLLNLLSNAAKYNRPGGTITVSAAKSAETMLRISVADSGRGIAASAMPRLFTPFDRLGAEETGEEGTGLGLTLCKQIVEAMDGSIGATSSPDGSTFWFELPLTDERPSLPLVQPPNDATSPIVDDLVLYIEDNAVNVLLLDRLIDTIPGVRLISAQEGRLGLDLARQHAPDVILLDLQLPDVDGREVLRQLRADRRTASIPVVILTADARITERDRLINDGADGYVAKPFNLVELRNVLVDMINRVPGRHRRSVPVGERAPGFRQQFSDGWSR